MAMTEWNSPETARLYEAFCRTHTRYDDANRALVAHASLEPGQRVLDFAAGTGRTAEAALEHLGAEGSVVCLEPASAMRSAGQARLRDPRITWVDGWTADLGRFERILCGAAIWQVQPLAETVAELAVLLSPGGALCFNIPALYLGQADEPGGGRDPWLLELPSQIIEGRRPATDPIEPLPAPDAIDGLLRLAGLRSIRWTWRTRLTQPTYRDWLKIPPTTSGWLGDLDPDERVRRIDRAFEAVDPDSWRWERWLGWTAWSWAGNG